MIENGATYEVKLRYCIILNKLFKGGLEAHPTRKKFTLVEQASCLLMTMVQHLSFTLLRITLQFHHLAVVGLNLAHRLRLTLARPLAAIE